MVRFLRAALCAAALLGLASCGPNKAGEAGGQGGVKPTGQVLNLYTARHYDADLQLYKAFEAATGIRIRRLEMGADALIERIKAEGDASPADVILTSDAGALWRAEHAGLFQPVTSAVLDQRIPAALKDAKGQWFGFSRRARVIAYDRATVRPEEVATYEAAASPRFKGKLCVRSSDSVYNLSLMSALIERWGKDKALAWARGVVANMARPPQGGDIDQIRAVAAGACEIALTNTYYYLRIAASKDKGDQAVAGKVELAFPDLSGQGTHVNISGGGVARYAPHRDAAVKFLEFLASDQAQAIFAGANDEYPAVAGVTPPPLVQRYANFKADPMPVSRYGERQAEAQALFDQAGWR
jgi:iron(III) transport system substrate-binding protein